MENSREEEMIIRILKSMYSSAIKEYKLIQYEKEKIRLYKIWSKKWNKDLAWLQEQADKDEKGLFYWGQLVNQEISMWASIAKKFTMDEVDALVKMRGFNEVQKQYLIDHAKLMGLLVSDKELKIVDCKDESHLKVKTI